MLKKIVKVKKTENTWKTPDGNKTLYVSLVATEDGSKYWTFSEKFVVGEEVDVEIEDSKKNVDGTWYDQKIKPAKVPFGGKGSTYQPRDDKAIVRQHSEEMALRRLELEAGLGLLTKDTYETSLIWQYTDEFDKDVSLHSKDATTGEFNSKSEVPENEELNLDDIPF